MGGLETRPFIAGRKTGATAKPAPQRNRRRNETGVADAGWDTV
jgi:hypothetical protein